NAVLLSHSKVIVDELENTHHDLISINIDMAGSDFDKAKCQKILRDRMKSILDVLVAALDIPDSFHSRAAVQ
ncbi:MAG TPA: hypothetical protein VEA58_05670, partial [Anaerovoracaceae bacterium]|nr:hypothetical protein [Anaerovoracaceae bacterium]